MIPLKKYWKLLLLLFLIIIVFFFFGKINYFFNNIEKILENTEGFNVLIYILLMIIAILIAPIPSSPLVILAGSFFGPFYGMLYTLIGATIGAVLAFLTSRFFLHDYLSKKIEKNNFYKKIKGKDNKNIAVLIFLSRLMPYMSFDIVSYVAGLTNINVITFATITFLGMIPIVFIFSFFGAIIKPYLFAFLLFLIIIFILDILYYFLRNNTDKKIKNL